jgi:BirA family biotin operon repressor/biotin-[acetyl-CoA-carboxylase] ligase
MIGQHPRHIYSEPITSERIRTGVNDLDGYDIFCFPLLSSTNDTLKGLAEDGAPAGTVVIAEGQLAGKGTKGRTFASPRGRGIYLSALFRPQMAAKDISLITPFAAVAAARAVERVAGISPGIKWVNDLLLRGKKLGGILTEAVVAPAGDGLDYVIVGIGLNVRAGGLPDELLDIAISIEEATGKAVDRSLLAASLLSELKPLLRGDLSDGFLTEYRRRCEILSRRVCVSRGNESFFATAIEIDRDGALIVLRESGEYERLYSGEVSLGV